MVWRRIVEAALGNAPNQRHLATLKADADRTAGARRLALATAPAGFAVPLDSPCQAVCGDVWPGTWFQIV
jgi:hypothetical protein